MSKANLIYFDLTYLVTKTFAGFPLVSLPAVHMLPEVFDQTLYATSQRMIVELTVHTCASQNTLTRYRTTSAFRTSTVQVVTEDPLGLGNKMRVHTAHFMRQTIRALYRNLARRS